MPEDENHETTSENRHID